MRKSVVAMGSCIEVGTAFVWAVPLYWIVIFPRARRELRAWRRRARLIPDLALRTHAMDKLEQEGLTAEGAAAFAILANARSSRDVVRLCVAFEVMYDYLDALAEQPVADVLMNNRRLYRALVAAVSPGAPAQDHYAHHPHRDDGGYLLELVSVCRDALVRLRSHESVIAALHRTAVRAGEAQSLHHAAAQGDHRPLASWAADQQPAGSALHWWELAAAAGSPLCCFALVAAAAHRGTTVCDAITIELAYFPWIAALSWLLESLVDQEEDCASGEHSYIGHYDSPRDAKRRLIAIADRAGEDVRTLPRGGRHLLLLAGMASMYLSEPAASTCPAREAADAVRRALGGPVGLLVWLLRLRRRLG